MSSEKYKVGMIVEFGRPRGEKTKGEIVKVNPKKLKVKQIGTRGRQKTYREGSVWTVPKNDTFVKILSDDEIESDSTPEPKVPMPPPINYGVVNHASIFRDVPYSEEQKQAFDSVVSAMLKNTEVSTLKQLLRSQGLPVSGRKVDLVRRVIEHPKLLRKLLL
jgi:hypothetical protein